MADVALDVDRAQVLAYRVAAHQLDRPAVPAERLTVLDLGVQETAFGTARLALAARAEKLPPAGSLATVWSTRGAPHLHRWADLPALASALWPLSDADATNRIATTSIKEGAKLGIAAFTAAAVAMHEVVTKPTAKGELSTAVTARVPESLTYWCGVCNAQHISGALFQQVGVAAGVHLDPGGTGTTLAPIDGWPGVPTVAAGTAELVTNYLRLHGPATLAEVAKFLGTNQTGARGGWPDGLTEIRVDGRQAWLPANRVAELRAAPRPDLVRLLPPLDPYLQARDRDLLVPGKQRQAVVWRAIGNPGAVLVDGEVGGTWRAKLVGKKRLDVTVTPFEPLPARVRVAVDAEAERMAAVRGAPDVRVLIDA
jgi:hypothetical protein